MGRFGFKLSLLVYLIILKFYQNVSFYLQLNFFLIKLKMNSGRFLVKKKHRMVSIIVRFMTSNL